MTKPPGRLSLWQEVVVYEKERPELFLIVTPIVDPDILPAIAYGVLHVVPLQKDRSKSTPKRRLLASRSVRVQLAEALADLTEAGAPPHDPVNVYCRGVASLPGEREVALAFALSPRKDCSEALPANLLERTRRAMADVGSYETRRAAMQAMGEPGCSEPPVSSEVRSFLGLFPPGLVVNVAAGEDEEGAIVEKILSTPDPRHPPPRDGVYVATLSGCAPHSKAWVTWQPHSGPPSYGEIRAAAERSVPHAFRSPRATLVRHTDLDPESSPAVRQVLCAGAFDPTDLKWLEDFHAEWALERQDDNLARAPSAGLADSGGRPMAWYVPHHVFADDKWGIYLDAKQVDAFVLAVSQALEREELTPGADALAARLVLGFVQQRELFHARAEAMLTWMELSAMAPRFVRYHERVHEVARRDGNSLQDALASHWAWSWLSTESIMSVVAGQMRPEDRGRLERILEARLDLENTGSLSWRAGRETASWRRLATQMVRGRPGVSPHGMGLPMEVFLRDAKLPFEFSGADVPLHFVGSGQVVTRLAAALAERGTPARAELRRAITEHFGCTVVPGGLERGYEEFAGPDGRTFRLPRRTPLGQAVFDEFLRHFALSATDYRLKVRPRLGWRSATTRLSQNERATGRSPSLGPA